MNILEKIKELLANDSARVTDVNGYLSVKDCNLSKADVNPYYGRDVPNWQELGLTPDKIYYMLRDPDELARAASTFNGKPLLRGHHDIHSEDIPKDMIIGSIGTDVHFESPFLVGSLTVWDRADIALIEHNKVKELSCSYFYTADMTSGEFNGVHYDGIMRDIVGNHVAVVEQGRAGSQVAVADSNFNMTKKGLNQMNLEDFKKLFGFALAKDAKDEDITEALKKADDEDKDESKAEDEDKEADDKACDESDDDKDAKYDDRIESLKKKLADKQAELDDYKEKAKGVEDKAKDEESKKANDAAMIRKQVIAEMNEVNAAKTSVRPFVGDLAMDSASDIYAAGLKHFGVNISGLPKEAYKATFEAVSKANRTAKANDNAITTNDSLPKVMKLKHL